MKRISFLFFASLVALTVFTQVPYYRNSNPVQSTGAISNGMPFGVNATAGSRAQYFYPPGFFGGGVSAGIPVGRLYFFADTTYVDSITYSNMTITFGEFSTAPTVTIGVWNTAATRTMTVLSGGAGTLMLARDYNWFYIDLPVTYVYDPSKYFFMEITVGGQSPFISPWAIKSSSTSGQVLSASSSGAGSPSSYSSGALPAIGMDPVKGLNNAGIERPVVPAVCASTQDVVVNVKNSGLNVISNVWVGWKVNGVTQAPLYLTTPLDTFGSPNNDTLLTLGTVSFATGPKNITAWTYLPNGVPDFSTPDDTVNFTMASSMTGTYTIGTGTANFPTISSAVAALYSSGVCGPVTFRIDTGVFLEQVDIVGRINGASSVNTITFEGVDRERTVMAWSSTIVNAKHILKMQNVAYVTFRNLTFRTMNPTYGWGVHLRDTCLAVKIRKCIIDISVSQGSVTANNTAGISVSGPPTGTCIPGPCATTLTTASRADSIEIDSNTILYGYEGINLTGNATTNLGRGNKIRNNTILYAYQNSINLVYQDNPQVLNNSIVSRQTGAACVGIFASNVTSSSAGNPAIIGGNKIAGYATAGISMNTCNNTDSFNKGRIVNNMVGGMEQLPDANPIYITGCKNWTVSNNSINHDVAGTSANTASGIRILGTTSYITIKNNIITLPKAGSGIPLHILAASNVDSMDRNVLYRTDTSQVVNIGGTAYGLAAFRGASGFNTNSAFVRPLFRNDTALYLLGRCNFPVGQVLSYVPRDIDNTVRAAAPVPGAHEYLPLGNNMTVLSYLQPISPITAGTYSIKVLVQNIGINAVANFRVGYQLNGGVPASQLITPGTPLALCDTMTVTITGLTIGVNDTMSRLSVYSFLPNGLADADPSGDTVKVGLYTPLGGDYTIGGAGAHFATFGEAAYALQTAGVKAAVRFNINPGTYNEQVTLTGPIAGSSPVKTITFEGNDAATRIVQFAGIAGAPHTFKIDSAPYVTVRNLTLVTTGTAWGWGLHITRGANACRVRRCVIGISGSGTTNTTAQYAGISVSGSTTATATRVDSLEIDSNTFNYGYNAVNIIAATGNIGLYNRIRNNTITNAYQNSIFLTYQQTPEVLNNVIVCRNAGSGIFCQNVTTPATGTAFTIISGNKITNYSVAGISMNACTNASATLRGRIVNNAIGGLEKAAAANGILMATTTNWYIANNSINRDFATTTAVTAAALRITGTAAQSFGNFLFNNVFAISGAGTALPLHVQVAGNVDAMDNNLFYRNDTSSTSNLMFLGALVGYYALKGSGGFNNYPSIYRPGFTSATDLTPNPADSASWSLNGRGKYLAYAPADINGVLRPDTPWWGVPDIGAYEFTPTSIPPAAKAVPDTLVFGTTQAFIFAGDTVAKISWSTSSPTALKVRQYSGVRGAWTDTLFNYMNFYVSVSTCPLAPVSIYYRDSWRGTHAWESGIRCTQRDSNYSAWTAYPTSSTVDTVRNIISMPLFYTSASVTFLSGTNSGAAVPVRLIGLSANFVKGDVMLNWSTASEVNSDRFVIERQDARLKWSAIGEVMAVGNAGTPNHYQFSDMHAEEICALGTRPTYRLRMIDRDGSAEYSKSVSVACAATQEADWVVYPNPFSRELYLHVPSRVEGDNATVTVSDLTGVAVLSQQIPVSQGSNPFHIGNELAAGVYFVKIELQGNTRMMKLVKE